MLTRVTIAGVDETAPLEELERLSARYPFVEWAVLWSETRFGTPRYPERDWALEFASWMGPRGSVAVHLCGIAAGQVCRGEAQGDYLIQSLAAYPFRRVQLNGFNEYNEGLVRLIDRHPKLEWVLQIRNVESHLAAMKVAAHVAAKSEVSTLWDRSGGLGRPEQTWPPPIAIHGPAGYRMLVMHYAGGITPATCLEVPAAIREQRELAPAELRAVPFGLDVESGVRREDRFDVGLAEELLEKLSPHVEQP